MKLASYISISAIALSILALTGCTKEQIVVPEANDPVFMLEGTLGGDPLSLTAGDNNAYMYTSVKIVNGVRVFSGELSDGQTSVEMGIYDGNLDRPNHVPEIDLSNILLRFAELPDDPLVVLSKDLLNQYQNIASVDWYINGLFEGNDNAYITEPGKYDVCAFVTFATGETAELCDEIIIGFQRSANCSITHQFSYSNQTLSLNAHLSSTGASVASVEWLLDGDLISTSPLGFSIPVDSTSHLLTAHVTFNNGTIREKSCIVNGSDPTLSIEDFSIFETTSGNNIPLQDYRVRLEIEKNGKTYKSILANNEASSITLLALEEYEASSSGNKVYKATFEVTAVVMDVSSEKLHPVTFTTTLGIEVP